MLNRLTQSLDFQAQALSLRAERQRLLASNIANVDTPGYAARDMNFAQALREATGSGQARESLARTDAGHMQIQGLEPGEANLQYALNSQTSLDSNTVDMDRERASMAENSVKYEATLRFLNGQIKGLLDAMKSPNQA
jgi:flagellar basal-body rod protein FlgB